MPASTAIVLLPFIAAIIFTFSALLMKRATELGAGMWHTAFVSNWISAVIFSSLLIFGGPPVKVELLWQPLCIVVCLVTGLLTQFLAMEKGDVSITVPVFGLKVIVVALLTPLLTGDQVDSRVWIAAFLCVSGIVLLNRRHDGKPPRNVGITLVAGSMAAASFATFDVLIQRWGPTWGTGHLLPLIFGVNAVFSFLLMLKFPAPLTSMPRQVWKWLVPGSILLSLQSVIFISTLAIYGKAAVANIVYSSRGLLSVLLVWLVGHWFANREQHLGTRTLLWRLTGAALMLCAIVIVTLKH